MRRSTRPPSRRLLPTSAPPSARTVVTPRRPSRASRSARSTRPRRALQRRYSTPRGCARGRGSRDVGHERRRLRALAEEAQVGRQLEAGVEDHADRIAAALPGEARGEARVVGPGGSRADQDGVGGVAEPVHQRARRRAGHPPGVPRGGGDAAVEGGRHLEGDVGAAALDEPEPRFVEAVAGRAQQPGLHLDAGTAQAPDSPAVHAGIGIARPGVDPAHAGLEDGQAAGRRTAEVVAGLERGVEVGASRPRTGVADGRHLGVGSAGPGVVTAADHAASLHEHRPHRRVGAGAPQPAPRLAQGEAHEAFVDGNAGQGFSFSPSTAAVNSPTSRKSR